MYTTVDLPVGSSQKVGRADKKPEKSFTDQSEELTNNPAYGKHSDSAHRSENMYEMVDLNTHREHSTEPLRSWQYNTKKFQRLLITICALGLVAMLALALGVVAVVLNMVVTNRHVQSLESESQEQMLVLQAEIEGLKIQLNSSATSLVSYQAEIQELRAELNRTATLQANFQENSINQLFLLYLNRLGSFSYPIATCNDLPLHRTSGEYLIRDRDNSIVEVYCDRDRSSCSCNRDVWWMRVANLDMLDPEQSCPNGLQLITRTTPPLRTCGRPMNNRAGCTSTTYPTYGVEYSQVCGRIKAYQYGETTAFVSYNQGDTIDSSYVDGISLTHGQSPRQHIWTFAGAIDETRSTNFVCPCTRPDLSYTGAVPPFIGQDYFCETASRATVQSAQFYANDPLWDGQGCGNSSTCCEFNNPPWFCKQLPQPTTNDIELRICYDSSFYNEDTPLERIEIYIQ